MVLFLKFLGETFGLFLSLLYVASNDSTENWEEDATWVRLAKQGDRAAYEKLYRKYVDRIYKYCYMLMVTRRTRRDDAKDATSEAFLRCFEKINSLQKDSYFFLFLRRTACNICMDILRKPSAETIDDPEGNDIAETLIDPREDDKPESLTLRKEVFSAVLSLDQKYRLAIIHVHYGGCTYEETARLMGCKENDVRNYVHRGIEQLQKKLGN